MAVAGGYLTASGKYEQRAKQIIFSSTDVLTIGAELGKDPWKSVPCRNEKARRPNDTERFT